jgi:hypothetical protein
MILSNLGPVLVTHPVHLDVHVLGTLAYALNVANAPLGRNSTKYGDRISITAKGIKGRAFPIGYDTVSAYFERTNPEAFALLYDPVEDLKEDEKWVAEQTELRGDLIIIRGKERAYPDDLIARRLD